MPLQFLGVLDDLSGIVELLAPDLKVFGPLLPLLRRQPHGVKVRKIEAKDLISHFTDGQKLIL